jgi:hypothetical protein
MVIATKMEKAMPFRIAWKKRYLGKSIDEFSYWLKAAVNNEFR